MNGQTVMSLPDFSIIILAAGDSSRLGQPKQYLNYNGKTLIAKIVDEAVNSGAKEIFIVANPNDLKMAEHEEVGKIQIIHNYDWETGIASSIATGIKKVTTDEAIIVVCDQPFVTAGLLRELIEKKVENKKAIASCCYAGKLGIPAAFNRSYFSLLVNLKGDEGAKKVIMSNSDEVCKIEFRKGVIDVDTQEDYKRIMTAGIN